MSSTGLEVVDKSLQTTHVWLHEVGDRLGGDQALAWKALTTVLRSLRDRLPVGLAAHFGAQLPLIVRGAFYDQFEPDRLPLPCDDPDSLEREVSGRLNGPDDPPADEAIAAVFALLDRHLTDGLVAKLRHALPRGARLLWDGAEARILAEAGAD